MSDIHSRKEDDTMTTFESGAAVQGGYYFNPIRWHVAPVAKDGEQLPAGAGHWWKVPTVVALALVPILGATFLMALPVIGFVVLAQALLAPVLRTFRSGATDLAATVSPGWQPGEAHLTGKQGAAEGAEPPASADAKLDALEREIAARRNG
jgi:hypothetical protein